MAGGFGTAEISKRYPVPSSSGLDADDYHEGRKISLEPEQASLVSKKVQDTL
jgi:hypothetical protein